ncbi:MAG TPA: hypothetical protein VHY19_13215, partial [Steroidobacteraceae bacterium]|nr:hypothetical protein [Steroidobacteraceae bacterium]
MSALLQLPLPLPGLPVDTAGLFGNPATGLESGEQLWIRGESNELRAATANEIIAAARRAMSRRVHRGVAMDSPRAVREFLAIKLGTLEHELFVVLLLDNRHRL